MMTVIALLLISLGNGGGPRAIPADGTERPVSGTPQGLVGRSSCEVPKEVPTYTWAADTRSATFKRIAPKTVKCEILGED